MATIENLADEQMKIARVLLNLGHSYLQCNSLENFKDVYEKEYCEKESQLNRTNKRTAEFQEQQINVFENIQPEIIKEIPISSNSNKQNESKEDTEINLDLKITVEPDFQNEINATIQNVKGKKQTLEETIDVELNIEVLDDLDSQSKLNDNVQIQHDIDTTQKLNVIHQLAIDAINQIDEGIEQEIEEIVDTMYDEESQVNIQVLNNLSEEARKVIQKKLHSDIDKLKSFLKQLDENSYKNVETHIVKQLHKLFPITKQDKYIKNTFISLHEKCAPFDERVEKLYNLYFPTMSPIHQDNTNDINSEFEKDLQKRRNEELIQELKEMHNINANMVEIDENWIHLLNNTTDNIDTETQIEFSNPMDIMKKALENFEKNKNHKNADKTQQIIEKAHDNCDDVIIDKVCQRFDIVIQLNKEIEQNVNGQPQIEVKENIQISLNEKMKKRFEHETHQNVDKIQQKIDKNDTQFCNKTQTIEEKIQNKVVEEMEVDSDGDIEMEIIKSTQNHLNNTIQDKDKTSILVQLEFYKHIQDKNKLSQKQFKNEIQEYPTTNMEIFKHELINMAKESDKFDIEIQDSDVDIENSDNEEVQFETEIQTAGKLIIEKIDKNIQEELGMDITNCDCEVEFESEIEIEVNDDKTEVENTKFNRDALEDFDVNIEDYDDEIQLEFEMKPNEFDKEVDQTNKSSLENIKTKEQYKNENINQQQLVEDLHEFEENLFSREMNEVVEIIKDVEIKSHFVSDEFTSTEKEFIFTEEEYISENESSVTEEEFIFIDEEVNCTKKECEGEFSSTDDEFCGILNEIKQEEELRIYKKLPKSQKMFQIKQDKMQIKQNQSNQKLNQQLKEFQTEFYSNLKQKYEKELSSKMNKQFNLVTSPIFDNQQQTFYELKDEFKELKEDYKSFIHEKWLNDLQVMDNELYETIHFAIKIDNKPDFKTNDMYNEFVNIQHSFSKLKPEFKCNVPIDYKEDIKSSQQKPFNLFEKLYSIHTKKLCSFVDDNQWPENCLYPSSLLDCLFEKPYEVVLNVLVITLYSIDIGYSIKISMKENELPVETYFRYEEDSILEYVENEQLPPHLLEVLDKAEPRLFYCGCVIAEIHDQQNSVPGELYRILLHPSNLSILSDLNQIVAETTHINWTYKRKLKLESTLLMMSHPAMCMDSSPIAGLTVYLQHQMLSYRKIKLNPLNNKYNSSKSKLTKEDLFDDLDEDTLITSKLSNKLQRDSSMMTDNEMEDNIHLCTTDKILSSSNINLQDPSINLRKEGIIDLFSLTNSTLPVDMMSDFDNMSLSREKLNTTDIVDNDVQEDIYFKSSNIRGTILPDIVISVSNMINDTSTISNSITVTSSIPSELTVVASATSNVLPSRNLILNIEDFNLIHNNLFLKTDENILPAVNNHWECINTELNSTNMEIQKLKHSEEVDGAFIRVTGNRKRLRSNLENMKTTSNRTLTESTKSTKVIPAFKHVHENGICLSSEATTQIMVLMQQQQTITDQVDVQSESQQLDGICSANITSLDPSQVIHIDDSSNDS